MTFKRITYKIGLASTRKSLFSLRQMSWDSTSRKTPGSFRLIVERAPMDNLHFLRVRRAFGIERVPF